MHSCSTCVYACTRSRVIDSNDHYCVNSVSTEVVDTITILSSTEIH